MNFDFDNLEGPPRTREEMAENFRKLNERAPTAAEKFQLMFGAGRPTPITDAVADTAWDGASDDYSAYRKMMINARNLERQRGELLEALDMLTLVVGLTPIAGNKEALQEVMDIARKTIAKVKG